MLKVLVPVDSSVNSQRAVLRVISEYAKTQAIEVHLLSVQTPFSRYIAQFVGKRARDAFHREEAQRALGPARLLLDGAGVPYSVGAEVGIKADVIAAEARRLSCHRIIIATARKNSFTRMFETSLTSRVLELTNVSVEVIAGDETSALKRYGVPIGVAVVAGLVLITAV